MRSFDSQPRRQRQPAAIESLFHRISQTTPRLLAAAATISLAAAWLGYEFGDSISEKGSALRFIDGLAVAAAAGASYILFVKARALNDASLSWPAAAYAVAAVAILVQAIALQDLATGGAVDAVSDGVAFQFLLFQTSLTSSLVLHSFDASWERWKAAAVIPLLFVGAASMKGVPLPDFVGSEMEFTPLFTTSLLLAAAYAAVSLGIWFRRSRVVAWAEVWIGFSVVAGFAAMTLRAVSATRYDPLWWASMGMRSVQFVIPAIGLLASFAVLLKALEEHQHRLAEGFRGEIHRLRNLAQVEVGTQYRRQATGEEVQAVMDDHLFAPVFQPIVRLTDGKLIGAEALTRFSAEPVRPPNVWFDAAESAGRGIDLELVTLEAALARSDDLPDDAYLSVNASPRAIASHEFEDLLSTVPLDRVVIEITEHRMVDDYDRLNGTLERLRSNGARVAVDDAGAGFATFRHIVRLNPEIIKLDVSLVRGIHQDPVRQALASALVGFAGEIGAAVVAEGIEELDELELLVRMGIDCCGQGYLIGRPGPLPLPAAFPSMRGAVDLSALESAAPA